MRLCPSVGPSARRSVDSWFFGLIGATTAVYTALFSVDAAVMSWSSLDMQLEVLEQLESAPMVIGTVGGAAFS
jgi:hypothetical protein